MWNRPFFWIILIVIVFIIIWWIERNGKNQEISESCEAAPVIHLTEASPSRPEPQPTPVPEQAEPKISIKPDEAPVTRSPTWFERNFPPPQIISPPDPNILPDYAAKSRRTAPEKLACGAAEDFYRKPFPKERPDWLHNPEPIRPGARTGNLELDCYNEELQIAIEYNGPEHYEYPNDYDTDIESFLTRVRRDNYKRRVCSERGIYLITVPHKRIVPYSQIRQYVLERLPENWGRKEASQS